MEILNPSQLASRLDYTRPLKEEPEKEDSVWCIPFEYGANGKGTRISIALAKTISAELRAAVAEAEKKELRRYFDREKERGDELSKRSAETEQALFDAKGTIAHLERRLRARGKKGGRRRP
jgi:hypothetical protein